MFAGNPSGVAAECNATTATIATVRNATGSRADRSIDGRVDGSDFGRELQVGCRAIIPCKGIHLTSPDPQVQMRQVRDI